MTATSAEADVTTTFTVTVLYASKPARHAAMRTGFANGMEAGYKALPELLASTAAVP